jgi:ribosome biogenesis GTPase
MIIMFESQIDLESLGWDELFEESFHPYSSAACVPGRIAQEHRGKYRVLTARGELSASLSGRLRHDSFDRQDSPAAGDWVAVRPRYEEAAATIVGVLRRKSQFIRGASGNRTRVQTVAANVDTIFLVMALNNDFNLRRMERYLVMAWESGAQPVVVLTKSDLCPDRRQKLVEVESLAIGAPVHVTSIVDKTGLDSLRDYIRPGKTVGLVGSSGVGKSTLVNYLAGRQVQETQDVRASDGRGRHTTTTRQLTLLAGGGMVLDTPGMRELQLWEGSAESNKQTRESRRPSGIEHAFNEIESLAARCRYRDCSHSGEPDCAVQAALGENTLDQARFRSYVKLQKELRYQERKQDKAAEIREKNKWKKLCRLASEKAASKRKS